MKKFIWSIPGLSIYIYTITILTQAGYYSYFNIPTSFVNASIKENVVFLYTLAKAIITLAGTIGVWWFAIVPSIILIIALLEKGIVFMATVLLLLSVFWFYGFGAKIAQNDIYFYTIDKSCVTATSSDKYIIPLMKDNISVIVPISKDNKMTGEFFVKDTSNLSCKIEYKNIGNIIK
ncbi:MAG: hypothetical protein WC933_01560 [Candidatus Paceibacterota bacterium]|jgi:hypothetical protein